MADVSRFCVKRGQEPRSTRGRHHECARAGRGSRLCGDPKPIGGECYLSRVNLDTRLGRALQHPGFRSQNVQAFLLGVVYVMFALWRLIDILENDLGGNTVAAEFTLFIKTRQVRGGTLSLTRSGVDLPYRVGGWEGAVFPPRESVRSRQFHHGCRYLHCYCCRRHRCCRA